MAVEILNTFPDLAQTQTVTLGAKTLRLTFQWVPRLKGWYVDIYDDETGDAILLRRRLNPGIDILEPTLDVPGFLFPIGDPDGEFGTDFLVVWASDDG